MLDLNAVRADFAAFLVDHAGHRHSLDAALMHVVEQAYRKGLADAQIATATTGDIEPVRAIGHFQDVAA